MLNKSEIAIVKTVLCFCGQKDCCLICENDLFEIVKKGKMTEENFNSSINSLVLDGYFEVIRCDGDGKSMLLITPKLKAKCYLREKKLFYRTVTFKIILAALGSVVAFFITKLLYKLF